LKKKEDGTAKVISALGMIKIQENLTFVKRKNYGFKNNDCVENTQSIQSHSYRTGLD